LTPSPISQYLKMATCGDKVEDPTPESAYDLPMDIDSQARSPDSTGPAVRERLFPDLLSLGINSGEAIREPATFDGREYSRQEAEPELLERKMQSESEKELQTKGSRDCSHDHLGEATAWGGQVDEVMRTLETASADLDMWKSRCRDLQNLVRSLLAERVILLNTVDGERNHNQINVSTINGFQNGRDSLAGSVRLSHYDHGIVLTAVAGEHAENDRPATTTDDLKTEQVMQDDTVESLQSDKEVLRNTIVDLQQENEQLVNIAKGVQQENEVLVNSRDDVLSDNRILRSALEERRPS
jgi:hypothetical protein